jgi:uracil permease
MDRKVNMFKSKNLAVIAIILVIGLGGTYGFTGNGMIPMFGIEIPALATAAIVGILLNLLLSIGDKAEEEEDTRETN